MAQIGAVFVFCSSCKILYFASSVHPKIATALSLQFIITHWKDATPNTQSCSSDYPLTDSNFRV